jgi:hypothetical protein
MAVATPRPPAAPLSKPLPLITNAQGAEEPDDKWWMRVIAWVALAVFIGVPIFSLLVPTLAGRVVWTIVVAALPLFIVLIGYHRWRRLCPLAFFAQIPVRLRRPGVRKVSPWLEANYYYVAFIVFFVSLWLRLIATNGDGAAISTFFVLISLAALLYGIFYTGKSWCNYVCPLSFIEKIYTEPHGLHTTENSQCPKCTACKKACPDINEENGYWKEIASHPKRFVYFAFPGLVWAFYFYYYLQSGSWEYYFGNGHGARWVNQPGIHRWAFFPGHDAETAGFYFLPVMPRALASFLTLAIFALLSFICFLLLERLVARWLTRRDKETDESRVRHIMFSVAAFTAFVTFYTFAGAPSLRLISHNWAPHLMTIVVVITASVFLMRRLRRNPAAFAEETVGRNIIKRWEWTDIKPPKDLREAFLIHTIRTRESRKGMEQTLAVYKEAVRETLDHGFVTREEVQHLESLRNQLQIKTADHNKIMAVLADEERALINDPAKQVSAEKQLQLTTYGHALERYLERALSADTVDDHLLHELRAEYRVTLEEHAAVLDKLLGGEQGLAVRLAEEMRSIERASKTIQVLELQPSPTHDFLIYLLGRRRARAVDNLLRGLSFSLQDEASRTLREGLSSSNEAFRQSVFDTLRTSITPTIAERLAQAYRETSIKEASMPTMTDMLIARTLSSDPYVRAAALYALGEHGRADDATLLRLSQDEHEIVRETTLRVRARQKQSRQPEGETAAGQRGLITIEKMIALRSAPIFSSLDPEDLAELARSGREDHYAPNEALCVQGEPGNEVFILLAGDVKVFVSDGATGRLVNTERAGGFIGEMAVLDPAPRSATVLAGDDGARVLRLDGAAFREALNDDPTLASGIIRTLAQRLRKA